jgi:hypothetical protein
LVCADQGTTRTDVVAVGAGGVAAVRVAGARVAAISAGHRSGRRCRGGRISGSWCGLAGQASQGVVWSSVFAEWAWAVAAVLSGSAGVSAFLARCWGGSFRGGRGLGGSRCGPEVGASERAVGTNSLAQRAGGAAAVLV